MTWRVYWLEAGISRARPDRGSCGDVPLALPGSAIGRSFFGMKHKYSDGLDISPYSPECVEGVFCELPPYGVLRSPHSPCPLRYGLRVRVGVWRLPVEVLTLHSEESLDSDGPPIDLPFGRCLCDRFGRKVLLVSSKTTGGGPSGEVIHAEETIERINRIVIESGQTESSRRGIFRAHERTTTPIALETDISPGSYSASPADHEHRWIL
jgi:hypothetical protein